MVLTGLSPMVDISRDPRWGNIAEGAGHPYLGSGNGKKQWFWLSRKRFVSE